MSIPISNLFAQNYSDQASTYFSKFLTSKSMTDLILKSLPTLDDCKLVFKGQNAYTYFGLVEDMKSKIPAEQTNGNEVFVDFRVEAFSTQDLILGKGNPTGGMKKIVDKLQPYVVFYNINLLREKGAEFGVSFNYWVKINNRWVYFLKPWIAFD
jgi:hypothetical protein